MEDVIQKVYHIDKSESKISMEIKDTANENYKYTITKLDFALEDMGKMEEALPKIKEMREKIK